MCGVEGSLRNLSTDSAVERQMWSSTLGPMIGAAVYMPCITEGGETGVEVVLLERKTGVASL